MAAFGFLPSSTRAEVLCVQCSMSSSLLGSRRCGLRLEQRDRNDFVVGFGENAGAHEEIAERFVAGSFARVASEQFVERGKNLDLVDVLAMQAVEPLAAHVGAEHEVVAPRRLADQRDFAKV